MTTTTGKSLTSHGNANFLARSIFMGFALVFLLSAHVVLNNHLKEPNRVESPAPTENASRWNPRLFKLMTFGHLAPAIDWMWIQVLLDESIKHVEKGTHPAVYYRLDLLADLDPAFFDVYHTGANLLAVIRNDGPGARDLLLKGDRFRKEKLESYPERIRKFYWANPWALPFLLSYVYLFELSDLPNAAIHIKEAAQIPGAPGHLIAMQKRLEKPGGEYEVGLRLLNLLIGGAKEPETKEQLLKKRNSLFISQFFFELNHSFAEFLKSNPQYRASATIDPRRMEGYFKKFLRETRTGERDPWGGRLSVDDHGKIISTTRYDRVFNLD